jgi:hypothetical protein
MLRSIGRNRWDGFARSAKSDGEQPADGQQPSHHHQEDGARLTPSIRRPPRPLQTRPQPVQREPVLLNYARAEDKGSRTGQGELCSVCHR